MGIESYFEMLCDSANAVARKTGASIALNCQLVVDGDGNVRDSPENRLCVGITSETPDRASRQSD